MKKFLKLFGIALIAGNLLFISCGEKDNGDNNGPNNNPPANNIIGFSYAFEDVATWKPGSVFVMYSSDSVAGDVKNTLNGIILKDVYTMDELNSWDFDDLDKQPKPYIIFQIPGLEGSYSGVFDITAEVTDLIGVLYVSGTTSFMGQTLPTGWVMKTATATITQVDLVHWKLSATISATMGDFMNVITEGIMGDNSEKILTMTIDDFPINQDIDIDITKKIKMR